MNGPPRRAPDPGARPVVRVVAPSGTLVGHETALQAGLRRLERAGCEVRFDPRRARDVSRGYLAGEDDARCDELLAALAEPGVDVVWYGRGGSGGARTADRVVKGAASLAPRHVLGFSDATTVLNALTIRLGWLTWHGPVVTSLGRPDAITFDVEAALEVLRGAPSKPLDDAPLAEGRLLGGNLTVLASLGGTSLFPVCRGALWLLEDVGESPYRLDRSLTQLRGAGLLSQATGVWLGDLGLPADEGPRVEATLRQDLMPLPVVSGAPAGHRGRLALLPLGLWVRVGADGAFDTPTTG